MANFKLVLVLILCGIIVFFIVQNAAVIKINFLFWSFYMSRVLLMFIVFIIGIHPATLAS